MKIENSCWIINTIKIDNRQARKTLETFFHKNARDKNNETKTVN